MQSCEIGRVLLLELKEVEMTLRILGNHFLQGDNR